MAPQNLNQVFFNNVTNAAIQSASGAYTAVTGAPAEIGVWDVDAGDWFATALTGKKRIQIVQGMPTGNPISTPIIDVDSIVRINYKAWTDIIPTRPTQTVDFGATATKSVMIRIALRTAPTAYANYYQDGTALDLSGGGYEFPLLGNFSAGRMIFNIELAATTETGLTTALTTAIANNKTLNALFSAADNGASGCAITARHYGVEFDVTSNYSDGTGAFGAVNATRTNATSNYAIALSDEKAQRARYGNFNRMYFPFNFPTFAQSGFKYDVIDIQYKHDWPSSTGIARAGELNTVRIYWGKSSTALSAATDAANTAADTVFGVTIGTSSEQLF